MKRLIIAAAALSLALAAAPASADTATGTLNVTAQVTKACTIVATDQLNLGTYNMNVTSPPSSANITVKCTTGTGYNLSLGSNRTLTRSGGSETLTFQLSDTSGGTTFPASIPGTGNGADQDITVYGQIAAGQYAVAGTYNGNVSVAVNY